MNLGNCCFYFIISFILNNNKPENEGDEKSNIWFKCNIPAEKAKAYLEMKKEESIDVDNENDLKAVKNIMLQNIKKYDLSRI